MAIGVSARKNKAEPGTALKMVRIEKGWKLADVARMTGFSVSTLSKIENGKSGLSYTKMMRLGQSLGVDIAQLLAKSDSAGAIPSPAPTTGRIASGTRTITKAEAAPVVVDNVYNHVCHAAELLRRSLHPMITEVKARSIEEFGELRKHPGEEFSFVLEGVIDLYCDQYTPARLHPGDSIYFDAGMGHAFIAVSDGPCRILSVFSET